MGSSDAEMVHHIQVERELNTLPHLITAEGQDEETRQIQCICCRGEVEYESHYTDVVDAGLPDFESRVAIFGESMDTKVNVKA
jgi:hypothetical protein